MSMRMGDETARARAEAIDPILLASEAVPTGGGGPVAAARCGGSGGTSSAMIALGFLVFMVLACFVGAHFAPSPTEQHLAEQPAGPSWAHWFGTDELSRDSLSRVLHGGQISLRVAFGVAILSTVIGVVIGVARRLLPRLARRPAHAVHRSLDRASRAADPRGGGVDRHRSTSGRSERSTWVARSGSRSCLSLLLWGSIARVVRGATLSLREHEFVDAARTIGASNTRIIVRHVLPNCVGPIIVNATLVVAEAILIESTLSFLGFGIQPPTPSWGNLLTDAIGTIEDQWWLTVFPGLAIFLTVLAVNFLGDGLRDALDPRRPVRA